MSRNLESKIDKIKIISNNISLNKGNSTELLAKPTFDGRIVGGFQIDIAEVPWQVSLQYNGHMCGGSILSENWILTAAHCIKHIENSPSQMKVRVGSSTHRNGGVIHHIQRAISHSDYNCRTIDYDFGLIKLKDKLEFNESVQPITLPNFDDTFEDDTNCLVTGWGHTKNPNESSLYLRGAEVRIVNQTLCSKAYSLFNGITQRMICAGNYEQGGKDCKYFVVDYEN